MMNEKAKELKLENTNFVTPHGLDEEEHYTTATELAKIADYALNNEKICNIVRTKTYTVTINGYGKNISNTNELLGYLDGVYGVKTGFTNGANRCLVTATKRGDMDIICIVLGADTKKDRTKDSIKLIEYAFKNYKRIDISNEIKKEYIVKKDGTEKINVEINGEYNFEAPIEKNKIIGNYKIKLNDEIIEEGKIYIENAIPRKDFKYYLENIIRNYQTYISEVFWFKSLCKIN